MLVCLGVFLGEGLKLLLELRRGGLLASHLELVHEGLWENNEEEVGFGAAFSICRRTAKPNWHVKMYMG